MRLLEAQWGRLVRVVDSADTLVRANYVIGQDVISNGTTYELTQNAVTQIETLKILFPAGTAGFDVAFAALDDGLGTVLERGYTGLPPYSLVPRNAAIRIRFSQGLDPATVNNTTVRISAGVPPASPLDVRYVVDPADPTVLIVDPTISQIDAIATGLPVNALGFPPSVGTSSPNITIQIPTLPDPTHGQIEVLRSSGGSIMTPGNGPTDPRNPTTAVRTFRAGNINDVNRGFLLDLQRPKLLGSQQITLINVTTSQMVYQFDVVTCAVPPVAGDVVQQGTRVGEVTRVLDAIPPDFVVEYRRVDSGTDVFSTFERASFISTYDDGVDLAECFLEFTPFALQAPVTGIHPQAVLTARFSEPMDPETVTPYDSFMVTTNSAPGIVLYNQFVAGSVVPSGDAKSFTFSALGPGMEHRRGTEEAYFTHIVTDASDPHSVRDLAGNPLSIPNFTVRFTLERNASSVAIGSLVLRFNAPDETGEGQPDWQGQLRREMVSTPAGSVPSGRLLGRLVTRFASIIDQTVPVIGIMQPFPPPGGAITGIQTPLVPLGSRMMNVWRYIDMAMTYPNQDEYNIDVERISYAPFLGAAVTDFFHRVQIRLAHSFFLPDEYIDTSGGQQPVYPNSGLTRSSFTSNVLDGNNFPLVTMFDGGFNINPLDLFQAPGSMTTLLPWPAFRDQFGEKLTFTWRNTQIDMKGGPAGDGADPKVVESVSAGSRIRYVGPAQVPSIGLPLLLEFRVWPDDGSYGTLGLNGFQTSIATTTSAKPTFRVFSSGGYDTQGQPRAVNPDDNLPRGGFNANPQNGQIGAPTRPDDNVVYWGQVDFVVKISRQVTRWFDTGVDDPTGRYPDYLPPVIEPLQSQQPAGTSLIVEYRAANSVTPNTLASTRGDCTDLYGEVMTTLLNAACTGTAGTVIGKTGWTTDISTLDGKRWIQFRYSLVADIDSGGVPALSATGLGYLKVPVP